MKLPMLPHAFRDRNGQERAHEPRASLEADLGQEFPAVLFRHVAEAGVDEGVGNMVTPAKSTSQIPQGPRRFQCEGSGIGFRGGHRRGHRRILSPSGIRVSWPVYFSITSRTCAGETMVKGARSHSLSSKTKAPESILSKSLSQVINTSTSAIAASETVNPC